MDDRLIIVGSAPVERTSDLYRASNLVATINETAVADHPARTLILLDVAVHPGHDTVLVIARWAPYEYPTFDVGGEEVMVKPHAPGEHWELLKLLDVWQVVQPLSVET